MLFLVYGKENENDEEVLVRFNFLHNVHTCTDEQIATSSDSDDNEGEDVKASGTQNGTTSSQKIYIQVQLFRDVWVKLRQRFPQE